MQIDDQVWKRFVKLKSEYEAEGKIFSRHAVKREFSCSEYDARLMWNLSRLMPVVLHGNGFSDQAALSRKNDALKRKLRMQGVEINRLARMAEVQSDINVLKLNVPRWQGPDSGKSSAIACAMLSDTHFDEVINPAEIGWCNSYDRSIATARLELYFRSLVKLKTVHFSGIDIDGLVLMMAGDMVSGIIHEELAASNEYPVTESIMYYSGIIIAGIEMLAEKYKRIMVNCVVGNHGRLNPKITFKGAVQDNFDYLLYSIIAHHFKSSKHVKFHVPVSPDAIFPVGNTTICLSHGNQFRGGSGWAGPLMPVMRGDTKKREKQIAIKQPYDVLCTAHFHSLRFLGRQIMNGSLIGYGEYASCGNFGFEFPQQAFFLVDSERGVTITSPIHCKAKVEPWELAGEVPGMFQAA